MTKAYNGCCKFCGQIQIVRAGENLTEEEVNKLAILECNCEEALLFQRTEQRKTYAEANIKKLFETEEELKNTMLCAVDMLATQKLKKVTFVTAEGIKATLTSKEKSIKVERTETNKCSLEG